MSKQIFQLNMSVRDYECDIQGIVNNSVYQNYLEHARHEFLKSKNIDFAKLTHTGINLVVVRAELDYKYPLRSGDKFYVQVTANKESRIKFAFAQTIYRVADDKLILKGKIIGTALSQTGRPTIPEELNNILQQ